MKKPNKRKSINLKDLEAERTRLYMVATQFSLTDKIVLKQSNVLDQYIVADLKKQLKKKTRESKCTKFK